MLGLPRRWMNFIRTKVFLNWQYKLAAGAAAFVIWSYVAGQQTIQAIYTVPIFFQNLPVGSEMTRTSSDTIQVTLSGRRDRMLSLRERQIWVSLDLSGMKIGRNTYQLAPGDFITPAGLEIKAYTPRKLTIQLVKNEPPAEALQQ
ncbi:MAG: hypothetical protein AB1439_09385 [candidate division FCPU426 bacterium]